MAAINDLINQIDNQELRARIQDAVDQMNKQKKFGLVFEDHLPEYTPLYDIPVKKGSTVALKAGKASDTYTVLKLDGDTATCLPKDGEAQEISVAELVCVAVFGEAIYPYLKRIDTVCNAPDSDLWHALIEADNYHALQLLAYLYAGKVDCIYIDPPYNTGAKDWKYNNNYVDGVDTYRHSKWLSMMQKRLLLAKRIIAKDGVLVTTIDDNEYAHLWILLHDVFPELSHNCVTIQHNPGGTQGKSFSVTNEYAIFSYSSESTIFRKQHTGDDVYNLRRWGSTSGRYEGATCFYPVYLDNELNVIGFGDVLDDDSHPTAQAENNGNGTISVWPIDKNGVEKKWRYARSTVESVRERMFVEKRDNRFEIILRRESEPPKTVWTGGLFNAEAHGTGLIKSIIGGGFSFPKSLYAVREALIFAVSGKKNALIVDFFAGSGTTLHAVNLLNAEDGGNRRCIIVTNNEVSADEAKSLTGQGYYPGDDEWEKFGIARYVTWPRTVCSIEGHDVNGNPLIGDYGLLEEDFVLDDESVIVSKSTGKPTSKKVYIKKMIQRIPQLTNIKKADGFKANAAYFKLGFLEKTSVALGRQFREMLPTLWMKAGAHGSCPELDGEEIPSMLVLPENKFAILTEESAFPEFEAVVNAQPDIETVYIVTDYEAGYCIMAKSITAPNTYQLYRNYLDNFRINAGRN